MISKITTYEFTTNRNVYIVIIIIITIDIWSNQCYTGCSITSSALTEAGASWMALSRESGFYRLNTTESKTAKDVINNKAVSDNAEVSVVTKKRSLAEDLMHVRLQRVLINLRYRQWIMSDYDKLLTTLR